MYRPFRTMFFLVILTLVCCHSRQATAFTLRAGPLDEVETTMPGAGASDLTTPQLFRIAIRQDDIIFGVIHPSEGFGTPEPAIGLPQTALPQPAQTSASQAADRPASPHHLRGVELLLLRDTRVVVEQPGE